MYVSLEDFTAAVRRLGELREQGLVKLRGSPGIGRGTVALVIDRGADGLPPKGGGLYAEVMDVLTAIAKNMSLEEFVRMRGIPGPDFDTGEEEAVARAKYEAAVAAFLAGRLTFDRIPTVIEDAVTRWGADREPDLPGVLALDREVTTALRTELGVAVAQ